MDRVLVTGGSGYLGSSLCRELLKKYNVINVDKGYFGNALDNVSAIAEACAAGYTGGTYFLVPKDFTEISIDEWKRLLDGVSTVIHLAGISTEPTAQINPRKTDLVNHVGTVSLATIAKMIGVKKFIFASSASVYFTFNTPLEPPLSKETDDVNPISAYALSKKAAEIGLSELDDTNFIVNIFRKGTLYGNSPRLRLDLVLNSFVKSAVSRERIFVHCNGMIFRPMLDIREAVLTYCRAVEVDNLPFIMNVATANWNLLNLAKMVREHLLSFDIYSQLIVEPVGIARNYMVDTTTYRMNIPPLPLDIRDAIDQLVVRVTDCNVDDPMYYNDKVYEKEWMVKEVSRGAR